MKRLNINIIEANYSCGNCENKIKNIPIQESIYNGPPICLNCGEEMLIDEVYENPSG